DGVVSMNQPQPAALSSIRMEVPDCRPSVVPPRSAIWQVTLLSSSSCVGVRPVAVQRAIASCTSGCNSPEDSTALARVGGAAEAARALTGAYRWLKMPASSLGPYPCQATTKLPLPVAATPGRDCAPCVVVLTIVSGSRTPAEDNRCTRTSAVL